MESLLRNPENKIKDISKILDETGDSLRKGTASLTKILSETRNIQKRNNQSMRTIIVPKEDYAIKKESIAPIQSQSPQQAQGTTQQQKPQEQKPQQPSPTSGALTFARPGMLFTGNLQSGQDVSSIIAEPGAGNYTITGKYGDYRPNTNTVHRGLDISGPAGRFIALKEDSEVLGCSPNVDDSGFGKWISLWLPGSKVQLLIGHCNDILITSGVIPAGKSFATLGSTGRSGGPHIHLQYSRSKRIFATDGPPDAYIGLLSLSRTRTSGMTTTRPNRQNSTTSSSRTSVLTSSSSNSSLNNKVNTIFPPILQAQEPQIVPVPVATGGNTNDNNSLYQSMIYSTLYG